MISKGEVIQIHEIIIKDFGGSPGIRNEDLLDAAVSRPFQTFDGKELYPTILDKSAAIVESLLKNHPFIDGNKRIGYVTMRLFMMRNGIDLKATEEEKYEFVISIASGERNNEQIKAWLEQKSAAMR